MYLQQVLEKPKKVKRRQDPSLSQDGHDEQEDESHQSIEADQDFLLPSSMIGWVREQAEKESSTGEDSDSYQDMV